ncbi:MAG: hypothetical protein QXX95_04565 [Nitrososphaerales archaeon]
MEKMDAVMEADKLIEEANKRALKIRLIGGIAIWFATESAKKEPFKRNYKDIDLVGLKSQSGKIDKFMKDMGYIPNERYNVLHSYRSMYFNKESCRRVDYFYDFFEMCHKWDLRNRLDLSYPTLPISDLLLSKLQIVKSSERDVLDSIALLLDYEFKGSEANYIAELCSKQWGLYKTVKDSLDKIKNYLINFNIGANIKIVLERIDSLSKTIEDYPKSFSWKLRSKIGEKVKWYYEPEEV